MYKCLHCNKTFKSKNSLSTHIGHHKDISKEDYYIKYIMKDNKTNICCNHNCNNKTRFVSIGRGYNKICGNVSCLTIYKKNNGSYDKMVYKSKKTKKELYGDENYNNIGKIKETKKELYGDENYNNRTKAKETCLDKYGVEHYSKTEECKEKTKETNINIYGKECPLQNESIVSKSKNTRLDKYDDENYTNRNKAKETKKELYGDENYNNRTKAKETCLDKYGVEHYSKTEECKEKKKETCLDKYGAICSLSNTEVINKAKETCLDKYGVEHYSKTEECREKMKETCLDKYGTLYPQSSIVYRNMMVSKGKWIPLENKSDYELYKYTVWKETNRNIHLVENIEKRENLKFSLDHKYSIKQGFLDCILPSIIGSFHNLEIIEWGKNCRKGSDCSIELEELINLYLF